MSGTTIKSSVTTLRIVEALKELEGARVSGLANYLEISKPTIHHHLSTLLQEGYVVKEEGRYYLGLKFLEVGAQARDRLQIHNVASSELDKLAEETGEIANVAVMEHGDVVYLYLSRGQKTMRLGTHTGKRADPHCTASGKVMLAHLPDETLEEVLARKGLPQKTQTTITERDELFAELERIREHGIAFDRGEKRPGLRCIAAPITEENGRAIGAVSVSGPANRFHGERFTDELPEMVVRAKDVIELNINFS